MKAHLDRVTAQTHEPPIFPPNGNAEHSKGAIAQQTSVEHEESAPLNMSDSTPPMQSTKKDLRIAVVGGGLCGLICAVGLTRAGVDVQLYEAAVSLNSLVEHPL